MSGRRASKKARAEQERIRKEKHDALRHQLVRLAVSEIWRRQSDGTEALSACMAAISACADAAAFFIASLEGARSRKFILKVLEQKLPEFVEAHLNESALAGKGIHPGARL